MTKIFLILPGGSPGYNRTWAKNLETFLKNKYPDCVVEIFQYQHWLNEGLGPNDNLETENLVQHLQNYSNLDIISKSFGTIVALRSLPKISQKINSLLILGLPVDPTEEKNKAEFETYIKPTTFPINFTQQEFDKYTPAALAKQFVDSLNQPNVTFRQIPGSDHLYDQFELFLY